MRRVRAFPSSRYRSLTLSWRNVQATARTRPSRRSATRAVTLVTSYVSLISCALFGAKRQTTSHLVLTTTRFPPTREISRASAPRTRAAVPRPAASRRAALPRVAAPVPVFATVAASRVTSRACARSVSRVAVVRFPFPSHNLFAPPPSPFRTRFSLAPEPDLCSPSADQGGFQQGGAGGFGGAKTCYSCGGVGHLSRDCVNPAKCFNCGQQGHVSRDCPQPAGQKSCYNVRLARLFHVPPYTASILVR